MERELVLAVQHLKAVVGKAGVKKCLQRAGVSPTKVYYRVTTVTRSQVAFNSNM